MGCQIAKAKPYYDSLTTTLDGHTLHPHTAQFPVTEFSGEQESGQNAEHIDLRAKAIDHENFPALNQRSHRPHSFAIKILMGKNAVIMVFQSHFS